MTFVDDFHTTGVISRMHSHTVLLRVRCGCTLSSKFPSSKVLVQGSILIRSKSPSGLSIYFGYAAPNRWFLQRQRVTFRIRSGSHGFQYD